MDSVTVFVNETVIVAEKVMVGLIVGRIGTGELVAELVGVNVGIGMDVGVCVASPIFIFPGEGFFEIIQSDCISLS